MQIRNEIFSKAPFTAIESWTPLLALTELPIQRSTSAAINVRDAILPANLDEGIPAQFVYEAADCRLFYTPAMISDPRAIWKKAANAAWGGAECASGSLKQTNETRKERKRRSEDMKGKARFDQSSKADVIAGLGVRYARKPGNGKRMPF